MAAAERTDCCPTTKGRSLAKNSACPWRLVSPSGEQRLGIAWLGTSWDISGWTSSGTRAAPCAGSSRKAALHKRFSYPQLVNSRKPSATGYSFDSPLVVHVAGAWEMRLGSARDGFVDGRE